MLSLLPFIFVHTDAALNDLLKFWDFDFIEAVRFNALCKQIRTQSLISSIRLNKKCRREHRLELYAEKVSNNDLLPQFSF